MPAQLRATWQVEEERRRKRYGKQDVKVVGGTMHDELDGTNETCWDASEYECGGTRRDGNLLFGCLRDFNIL